ncbi:hypothetical protein A3C60_00545 [Candidatus Nomurabacteria bacterium RIFCSPHIGHO2_02_FULL_37_45]|uniref:Uncharacterized protein n=2 Tax=Candidatus Nomuraibacteriota TaxID=1752729 RepID=A0A1F6Y4Z6_9BACT|nr:MAG: hypothetical protein A2727_01585 [Candidatus Nomurabacteria bacterium RIFCSPHIGHO2_01_FULL_37_110]OGI70823.1 MAG: hypothetical protein A3C60_00545 [Candidatus Nomurabacteria bacterium RIFCSPHIGHO2_02_FULL_37_45]OGI79049.1 MAG: hypothetical protein A3F19_03310 [Candidatus Nomurabacteria bacterium RIFCSPHIGHO2_12_FULL_37_29]OGI84328.1 MAG: hypothetical protein A3A92_01190 [Candidatus Nomurabacteria bacterium RIFCSPLOWO2_01_FULL_37_49]OGJ01448.1 MAG: hypothetical protein A3G98_00855 [Candi
MTQLEILLLRRLREERIPLPDPEPEEVRDHGVGMDALDLLDNPGARKSLHYDHDRDDGGL